MRLTVGRWMLVLLASLTLAACNVSSGGGSDDGGSQQDSTGGDTDGDTTQSNKTRLTGTVTLSSSVAGANKPGDLLMRDLSHSPMYKSSSDGPQLANKPVISSGSAAISRFATGSNLSNAYVYVYDADHPEWLAPVAQDKTDSDGAYDISTYGCTERVSNGDCSALASANDNAYVDGDSLPTGTYTMLVYKPSSFDPISGVTTDPIVAVMPAFKAEDENVSVENTEAEVSDVTPRVLKMFGKNKNTDGTNTWGSAELTLAPNTSVQINFDMAMSRGSVQNIEVTSDGSTVAGSWKLSADWLTATFKPEQALAAAEYQVEVPTTVTNVYGNTLNDAAYGSFTALADSDQTAPTVSLTSPSATSGVETSEAIRISSDEPLDINGIKLDMTPDVGVPGVMFIGETDSSFLYEFTLADSLQLDTAYDYSITGLADLAGNTTSDLSGSFSTESADTATGVDTTASDETKNAQASIAEIFAKWVRAMNDRNLSQLQSMMSGSFIFEYSVLQNGFMPEDINRNGRLSLNEFISMMESGMTHWEYCGVTITGDVVGNVNVTDASQGDLEFTLDFTSDKQSQECLESGPQDSLYATVRKTNSSWKLSRMSEGFDHRGTQAPSLELLEAVLSDAEGNDISSGSALSALPTVADPLTFRFDTSVSGVDSYILLLANARHPEKLGVALAISESNLDDVTDSNTMKSLTVPDAQGQDGLPAGVVDVSELFGFDTERDWGIEREGEAFLWEIIGLDTLTPGDFASEDTQPTVTELVRDFAAVSAVKKFKNPGERKELDVQVQANSVALTFDEFIWGYDAGMANSVDITVTTPNVEDAVSNGGFVQLNSNNGWDEVNLVFSDNSDGTASATATLNLFEGWNWVNLSDGDNLYKEFQVHTEGGKAPAIEVLNDQIDTFDTNGSSLGSVTLNEWNYADTPSGTTTLDVTWDVDETNTDVQALVGALCSQTGGWADLNIWVHNDSGAYAEYRYCDDATPFTLDEINGTVMLTDLTVFEGENWININLSGDPNGDGSHFQFSSHFGVFTDTGSPFVPPVEINTPTTSEGNLTETANWGQGSDWNATEVTVNTSTVTVSGTFDDPGTGIGFYNAGAEGAHDQGELTIDTQTGEFSVDVTLYQGWNWIGLDNGNGDFYNLNVYTDNGMTLPKPEIADVNGVAPTDEFGQWVANIGSCTATLNGTAPGNTERLMIDWQGSTNADYFWENQEILLDGGGTADGATQSWSATFQVIGGSDAYNFIHVFDDTNGTFAGVEVRTSGTDCTYTQPVLNITGVSDGNGTALIDDFDTWGLDGGMSGLMPVTTSTVTLQGTSTVPGRSIKVSAFACGSNVEAVTQSSDTANGSGEYAWSLDMPVYDPNPDGEHYQWMDVSDGYNWQSVQVISDNGIEPPAPAMSVTPSSATLLWDDCGSAQYEYDNGNGSSDANGSLVTVTLSGTTNVDSGTGEYWAGNSFGTFQISNGSFSVDVELYDGDNWIDLSDAEGNHASLSIQVTNGEPRPQFVYITDPQHNATGISGDVVISGDFGQSGFAPDSLQAWVDYYDPSTDSYQSQRFDSMLQSPNEMGDQPMTYDPNNPQGGFSLTANLPQGVEDVWVNVDGCGMDGCHGHSIALNPTVESNDSYYKADNGGRTAADQARLRRLHDDR